MKKIQDIDVKLKSKEKEHINIGVCNICSGKLYTIKASSLTFNLVDKIVNYLLKNLYLTAR